MVELDPDAIRARIERASDEELVRMISEGSEGWREEVLALAQAELDRRESDPDLVAPESETTPELNAATAGIDEQVYLMNYRDHYAAILEDSVTQNRLAELFLFRAWTAQFGFRIFSTDQLAAESLIGETVNSCRYVGVGLFEQVHGFSIEEVLGGEFLELVDDRWRGYDVCITSRPTDRAVPTQEVIAALTARLGLADPRVTYQLSMDFLGQLEVTKNTTRRLGLLP